MALTDIINKILEDAKSEAATITESAEQEATRILLEAKTKAETLSASGAEGARMLEKETHERALATAQHHAHFAAQGFRASLLERAFEEVEKKLAHLPKDEYREFVHARAKSLPEKDGILTVAKERKEETLAALKDAGVSTKHVEEASLIGGFVLETKTAEYDHSLKEISRQARETLSRVARDVIFTH